MSCMILTGEWGQDTVMREGRLGRSMFLIESGEVDVYKFMRHTGATHLSYPCQARPREPAVLQGEGWGVTDLGWPPPLSACVVTYR